MRLCAFTTRTSVGRRRLAGVRLLAFFCAPRERRGGTAPENQNRAAHVRPAGPAPTWPTAPMYSPYMVRRAAGCTEPLARIETEIELMRDGASVDTAINVVFQINKLTLSSRRITSGLT
ncbi:hypothetical protein EVAR_23635_1 [Eumeta japonica]|uniref:Uncharacterized protein n=1 Tax=Eumeta variegata TaxID=151549 RepID=A0A4C1VIT3_EUMVA|nr:hypothetical protein EVAR_23635_1 [Eumeta japonica]